MLPFVVNVYVKSFVTTQIEILVNDKSSCGSVLTDIEPSKYAVMLLEQQRFVHFLLFFPKCFVFAGKYKASAEHFEW